MADGTTPQASQGGSTPVPGGTSPQPVQPVIRPGDSVPAGGLDPTQVFATPPPPPPQQDDASAPPQDNGPPPPPPGVKYSDEQLKQWGYDDEDVRILKEVGDYRFASISATLNNERIAVPAHPETTFDEQVFLTLLRGSISLTRDEKWRIIQAIPKLSQFQIDELQKILDEEKRKFSELSPKHLLQLMKLEQRHSADWRDLQSISVQQDARSQEQSQAADIRKQLGL